MSLFLSYQMPGKLTGSSASQLFNLIEDLTAAGILNVTQTGQTIKGGEILLKRGMIGL